MAAPVPYWAESNIQQYTPSFPPPIYYRDTFGLEPVDDHSNRGGMEDHYSLESEESGTTKSTVRNQINIFHPNASVPGPMMSRHFAHQPRRNTGFSSTGGNLGTQSSQHSQQSTLQSMQVEELLTTDQVLLIFHSRQYLWISTILFGVALQSIIFSSVCLFFDGHCTILVISILLFINSILLLTFARHKHTRLMMWICICSSAASILVSVLLFASSAYFIHTEDLRNEGFDEPESNKIVQNARMTMYSLLLVYAPIYVICCGASLFILLRNLYEHRKGRGILKGFFLSRTAGHQKVLVPIKLRQVGNIRHRGGDESGGEGATEGGGMPSIGIQTSAGFS